MRQAAPDRLLREKGEEAVAVEIVESRYLVDVVGHRQRRALQAAGVLLDIGLGDRERGVHDHLGPELEPAVEPDVERHGRSEEHTSELQSRENLVCRLLLEKK